jgi:hypothetical protein
METAIVKMLITKYRKDKTLESWKVLENLIEDKSYCRDCNESIFYPNSLIRLGKDGNIKYDISKSCSRSFKELNGVSYYLSVCSSCLDKKFDEYSSMNKSRVFNIMNRITRYAYNIPDDVANAFTKTTAVTLENLVKKYGEIEGNIRWEKYRNLQAVTNTFEYKKEKYGWNKSDFDEFNQSRAITEKNLINRHGDEKGKKIFSDYCKKQITNGKTLEWFIMKHGYADGLAIFDKMLNAKLKGMEGIGAYSTISQDFFDSLDAEFGNIFKTIYYRKNGEEKRIVINVDGKYKLYYLDYFIPELNIAVEFFGNYYHANPQKYKNPEAVIKFSRLHTVGEIWERDRLRIENLEKHHGIKTIVVWESDYYKNKNNDKFYKDIARLCIEKK